MNKQLFKYYQALNNDTIKTTAQALNIAASTLSCRLNGKRGSFTNDNIAVLRKRWNLTLEQCADIFLT